MVECIFKSVQECNNILVFHHGLLEAVVYTDNFTLAVLGKSKDLRIDFLSKRLGITVFQPRLKVRTFARTNYYEYGKQRQVQESP